MSTPPLGSGFSRHPETDESATTPNDDVARLGKTALVVGATVLVAYGLFRLLTPASAGGNPENSTPAPQEPTDPPTEAEELAPSPLLTAIKGAMVSFLLAAAREKLPDLIAQFNQRIHAHSRT